MDPSTQPDQVPPADRGPTKIAFINQKGGVGKTTLTANCGAYWGRAGRRVLMLDLDPQAHLSLHLGAEPQPERNLYQVLRGSISMADARVRLDDGHVDVISSHIDLSAAEWEFGQEVGREVILRELLANFLAQEPYDMVLVDCPPSLGFLSLNALAAVDEVVIPVQAEFFALQGMAQLLHVLEMVQARLHTGLRWQAIVPTLVDARTNLAREVIAELDKHFAGIVTRSWISKRIKVAEAPSFGESVFQYAPDSPAAIEFATLARELEERLGIAAPGAAPRAEEPAQPVESDPEAAPRPPEHDHAPGEADRFDESGQLDETDRLREDEVAGDAAVPPEPAAHPDPADAKPTNSESGSYTRHVVQPQEVSSEGAGFGEDRTREDPR